MSKLVSLEDYKAKHCEAYLTGIRFEAWSWWLRGINPLRQETVEQKRAVWDKAESDRKQQERRKRENQRTKREYKL